MHPTSNQVSETSYQRLRSYLHEGALRVAGIATKRSCALVSIEVDSVVPFRMTVAEDSVLAQVMAAILRVLRSVRRRAIVAVWSIGAGAAEGLYVLVSRVGAIDR